MSQTTDHRPKDAQAARIIDALEQASLSLSNAKKAMFFADMPEYSALKHIADSIFALTADVALAGMQMPSRVSLVRSLETRIAEARRRYEAEGEIDQPYAQEWLGALEQVRTRLLCEDPALVH